MSEPYLGMIIIVPYNFSPRGWAFCNGQILPIAQNTALFSLLGTTFGGNGQTTFALPDLRGRVSNSSGQGPGLSSYDLGQVGGTESTTLTINQMPVHNHQVACFTDEATSPSPKSNFFANTTVPSDANAFTYASTANNLMAPTEITNTGGSQPFGLLQPYLTLNYCIALEGIFPSRN
ncbi:MAG: tail fiber protein [Blastocatellia bacterium]